VLQRKKICMLGAFSVGKTSLVRRYVESTYSDEYLTTVGVNVRKKTIATDADELMMMLWDLSGDDEFQKLRMEYLNGASGFLLVADGTRRTTLEKALELHERVQKAIGTTPAVLVLNKIDLAADWEITPEIEQELRGRGWQPVHSSAKTGEGVEEAFLALAGLMLGTKP